MKKFELSKIVSVFEESATLLISSRAKRLAAEGRSIVNFGAGELDFNTPAPIIEDAYAAAKAGWTKYTPVGGVPELRAAVAERISSDYGIPFQSDEVMVSAGGKQAIFHFLQTAIEPGDEVIIFAPYWVSFPEMVKLVGGKPVIIRTPDFRIRQSDVEAAITSKTRALILNSPSNPSGQLYSRDEIQGILNAIRPHPIWLLSDDTYYRLVFGELSFVSALQVDASFRDRTCVVGSTSKSYSMTGWRVGYALAPKAMIQGMIKIQSQVTSGTSSVSQAAALSALTKNDHFANEFRSTLQIRRDLMVSLLKEIPGLEWVPPEGAFYVFVDFSEKMPAERVTAFSAELLENYGVCAIPGEAFGADSYLRFSYAASEEMIREGMGRLKAALKGV